MEEGSGERMKGGVHSVVLYKVEGKEEEMDETDRGWNVWGGHRGKALHLGAALVNQSCK